MPLPQIQTIFSIVRAKEIPAIKLKFSSLSLPYSLLIRPTMAKTQQIPALTAGGKRDAEMATPTSDEVLLPRIDKATPIPLVR